MQLNVDQWPKNPGENRISVHPFHMGESCGWRTAWQECTLIIKNNWNGSSLMLARQNFQKEIMCWTEKMCFHQSFGSLPWNRNAKLCAGLDRDRETFYPILLQQTGVVEIPDIKSVFFFFSHQNFPVCCCGCLKDYEEMLAEKVHFYFSPKLITQQRRNLLEEQGREECLGTTRCCASHTWEESTF